MNKYLRAILMYVMLMSIYAWIDFDYDLQEERRSIVLQTLFMTHAEEIMYISDLNIVGKSYSAWGTYGMALKQIDGKNVEEIHKIANSYRQEKVALPKTNLLEKFYIIYIETFIQMIMQM